MILLLMSDTVYFIIGTLICLAFGGIYSIESVWNSQFSPRDTYLKAGEYGESEAIHRWSLWREPLNAWTSLAYSLFGFVILFTGIDDALGTSEKIINIIALNPSLSILYGLSCIYLGAASFLFHASHHEFWRKADAGMTSGVAVMPFVYGVFAHSQLPATNSIVMTILAFIFQLSLTQGYLPYGSSDVLLPSLIAVSWVLELAPIYSSDVGNGQIRYWLETFYSVIGGMLLRAADIKRKSDAFYNVMKIFVAATVIFAIFLGPGTRCIWLVSAAGVVVYMNPAHGHIFWHLGSSYALFHWWQLLRARPGTNPTLISFGRWDLGLIGLLFCVVMRNAVRRLLMSVNSLSSEMKTKLVHITEHAVFAYSAYYLLTQNALDLAGDSAPGLLLPAIQTSRAYTYDPVFPSSQFFLYYLIRAGCLLEEHLYMCTSLALATLGGPATAEEHRRRNYKVDIHAAVAAGLAVFAYYFGFAKIGLLGKRATLSIFV